VLLLTPGRHILHWNRNDYTHISFFALVTRRCNCLYGLVTLGQAIFCFFEGVLDQALSEGCAVVVQLDGKAIFQLLQKTYLPFNGQFLKALIARLSGVPESLWNINYLFLYFNFSMAFIRLYLPP